MVNFDGVRSEEERSRQADRVSGRLARCGILVAEADEAQRKLVYRLLEIEGANVTCVPGSAEAIAYLFGHDARDEDTSIVLLNANLPDVRAINAVDRLRDGGFKQPIIAMAWDRDAEQHAGYIAAGYTDLIMKPIRRDELISKLATYVHRPTSTGAPA